VSLVSIELVDRVAIEELISLHGHLFDEGELGRLDELFTEDPLCPRRCSQSDH
jgi:hypothetical protein